MPLGTKILFWFVVSVFALLLVFFSGVEINEAERTSKWVELKPLIQQQGIITVAKVTQCNESTSKNRWNSTLYYQFMAIEPLAPGQTVPKIRQIEGSVTVTNFICGMYSVRAGKRPPLLVKYLPEYPDLPIFVEHDELPNVRQSISSAVMNIICCWPVFVIGVYTMYKSMNQQYYSKKVTLTK